jgi:hypothetical protein
MYTKKIFSLGFMKILKVLLARQCMLKLKCPWARGITGFQSHSAPPCRSPYSVASNFSYHFKPALACSYFSKESLTSIP